MGQLRFRVRNAESYDPSIWQTAYVSGLEGIPWSSRNRIENDVFILDRAVNESGKLSIVWPTEEYGPLLLSTASLRCQESPYILILELARGTIHRIRGRALDWQRIGLKLPDVFHQTMDRAIESFVDAVLAANDLHRCTPLAQRAIDLTIAAAKPLGRAFISQSLQARHQSEKQLSTLLGVKLTPSAEWSMDAASLLPAINTVHLSMEQGQLEGDNPQDRYGVLDQQLAWARDHSLRVFAGPLLNLQPHAIPRWLYLFNDFESLYDATCKHATQVVERYRGQVHLWTAAAGLNTPNTLGLTDEQILHLAVGVIQSVRRADPKTPVIVTIDAPWAEYLGQKSDGISPLHFADALVRADLGLSGLGLELNLNYWPYGSLPRDLIDLSDLIDHWNILGLPLKSGRFKIAIPHEGKFPPLSTMSPPVVACHSTVWKRFKCCSPRRMFMALSGTSSPIEESTFIRMQA
ncbi:MAG: glycoside hydrolase family 10 [Pirellula sp.]|nr:glycoside hydrolase family 10 [Pirellula sp.]